MSGFVGLLKIELPDHTAYLTDGGFIEYDGDAYSSSDSLLGTIAAIEGRSEGVGGDIPALDIVFNPPSSVAITTLTAGAIQRSTIQLWLAEYDRATNSIVGTPDLQFIGQLDQPAIAFAKGRYEISLTSVSKAEWFFERDTGNGLSPAFHKSLYPGETGHDNATGLSVPDAWGVAGPTGGAGSRIGGGGNRTGGSSFATMQQVF